MAKAEAKPAAEGEQAPKKKGKLLIIIIAAVVLLGALGAGAFFMLGSSNHDEDEEVAADAPKAKKKGGKESPPVYVALENFTVNLVPDQGEQYLQVAVSLELGDAAAGEQIKLHMPKLRNKVMLLLSSKKGSDLVSKEGKETLAEEMKQEMNGVLDPAGKGKDGPIKEVLFTSFIIQ